MSEQYLRACALLSRVALQPSNDGFETRPTKVSEAAPLRLIETRTQVQD